MKTLFPGLRVRDLDASLAFYETLGHLVLGTVELVQWPAGHPVAMTASDFDGSEEG